MNRAYYSNSFKSFLNDDSKYVLGKLTKNNEFSLEDLQKNAWIEEIRILKTVLNRDDGHLFFEYSIPRMGKRIDVAIVYKGIVFLLEFKINEKKYSSYAKDQVLDYALDLKYFHNESQLLNIVPIVVATKAPEVENKLDKYDDNVFKPVLCNSNNIMHEINRITKFVGDLPQIDPVRWSNSIYKPTPTIVEAAQALYKGHNVKEISRSDSGAFNLTRTSQEINRIIEYSKSNNKKSICFVTGVPGAGKTLAGLNIANERHNCDKAEHAVFLSGNGPLVEVLQEALARDEVKTNDVKKKFALKKAKTFIQNIHHFRDDALKTNIAPIEKVVIFDEAQRAWNKEQTMKFMSRKKGISNFNISESEFLISIMDRHKDWCVIVCLIGGGQEINTGEAGLIEWFNSIKNKFLHWDVYISSQLNDKEYTRGEELSLLLKDVNYYSSNSLHLNTSVRSFRSENVSEFVKAILDCNILKASQIYKKLRDKYSITLTRDLNIAKQWIRTKSRGNERIGLIASSGAYRLRPEGINTKQKVDAKHWFLEPKNDVRSSYYLEEVATEFDIQGLELDWTCVAWGADLRFCDCGWTYNQFRGTKWQKIRNEVNIQYLINAYRVLLTRARQGFIIFIPRGDDNDFTRPSSFYNGTYEYLKKIGIDEVQSYSS